MIKTIQANSDLSESKAGAAVTITNRQLMLDHVLDGAKGIAMNPIEPFFSVTGPLAFAMRVPAAR